MAQETNGLKISKVEFHQVNKGSLLAFAAVTFNGVMKVEGWKIMDGRNGRWVGVPSEKNGDEWKKRIWFSPEWRNEENPILAEIMGLYEKESNKKTVSKSKDEDGDDKPAPW